MAASDKGTPGEASNFIRDIIDADLAAGRVGRVVTRFPPEPNGYLHIGHAKSICLNFGLARDYGGVCHLRFDDTNPTTEDPEYVASMQRDVRWLGFDWGDKLFYASDYYERLYQYAVQLIEAGKAYVCSLSEEEIRRYRGTAFEPGRPSPYRDRSVAENLDLFRRMRAGEFPDGAHVLRGKIDMASPNLKMRDWPFYRIRHAHHYRTGDAWCIYPLYDFAHCLSDLIEGITHSICTLEFENNRELYDWIVDAVEPDARRRPHQYEFARLEVTSVMTSKRKLLELVEKGRVTGWDDPRMPTLAGLGRRGYTAAALRDFCERVGVAKNNSTVEFALLEHVLRESLDPICPRVFAVLKPVKLVIENFPEERVDQINVPYWPRNFPSKDTRKIPFSRELYIDRDDFMENPPAGWHRLALGQEVRLHHACIVRCERVVRDEHTNQISELYCSYDPKTKPSDPGWKRCKGTIQWVSAVAAVEAEVRLYDRLFATDDPGSTGNWIEELNPASLVTVCAKVEPSLAAAQPGDRFQFERLGFFYVDPVDSRLGAPVFNRTVVLKDTWTKTTKADGNKPTRAAALGEGKTWHTHLLEEPGPFDSGEGRADSAKKVDRVPQAQLSPEAEKLRADHGIAAEDARILAADAAVAAFFAEAVAAHPGGAKGVARWIVNEVLREAKAGGVGALPFRGAAVGELCALIDAGTISGKIAKEVFAAMLKGEGSPRAIVEKQGIRQISDEGAIEAAVTAVLAESADAVARYRAGNANVLGALVGAVLKRTGGKANPRLVNELLRKKLDAG